MPCPQRKCASFRCIVHVKHKATRTRSRLEELTFGTFNVRTAAVTGVNGIGHIDTLLTEIVSSGYRVFFSGDCSGVKGRKGQHGVGLAIKEEIV